MALGLTEHERRLAEQDKVGLASGWYNATRIIIDTDDGIVRFDNFQSERPGTWQTNQYLDLNEQNAVTDAIKEIERLARQDIAESQELQDLLAKDTWSYKDRCQWERMTSEIVSKRHDEVIGLDKYRTEGDDPVKREADLAKLGEDVGKTNPKYEHDCESMRSIEGIVLSLIEKKEPALRSNPSQDGDYKIKGNYIAVNGGVKFSIEQETGGHAFLISSLTGNIIEGTADPDDNRLSPYNDTGENYNYADFIAGKLAATQYIQFDDPANPSAMSFSVAVYGSYNGDGDDGVVAERQKLIEKGDFAALKDATFGDDSDARNEAHFKSAFYQAGKVTFTVYKQKEEDVYNREIYDEGGATNKDASPPPSVKDLVEDNKNLAEGTYDKAFFGKIYDVLQNNGFTQKGHPVVLQTEDGRSYLINPEDGEAKVYDVTGKDTGDVTVLYIDKNDLSDPQPEPEIEVCPQLGGVQFSELLDGKGILSDKDSYNDADALKGMVQAAKDLGLPESFYGHIEEAMADNKFVSTAASIKAIKACHEAMEEADKAGLDDVQKERMIVKTFFENVTSKDLIVDTEAADDVEPFDPQEREEARKMAQELDADMADNAGCSVINPGSTPTLALGLGGN